MKAVLRLFCLAVMALCLSLSTFAKEVVMSSPDNSYQMTINDNDGVLKYSITYKEKVIVESSQMGVKINQEWLNGITITNVETSDNDTEWVPVYGERSKIRDRYRSWVIMLNKEGTRERLGVEVRAYNEGIAFRYNFYHGRLLKITDEFTEYVMPAQTMAYYTERAQTPYQYLPLKNWPNECDRPLLMKLENGLYVCLTEAQVVDYVRTKYALSESKPNTIKSSMYGEVEDITPNHSPWRVVMAAEKPGDILENNDIILNLNPPCAIKDVSWIKPGKMIREVTLTTEGGLTLIDFAVKHKLQYILFDAGWYGSEFNRYSDATTVTLDPQRNPKIDALDLQKVIDYGKQKGVGVFLYVNQQALQQQLDDILPLYKSWGVAGLKFGFVHVGSYRWTAWMHDAVKRCAQYGLLVDIHDEYRPTGFSRTYPNLLNQEGIRGNEEFPDATHNTILPFTRYVAGAADYTICYYRQDFGRFEQQTDDYGVPRSKSIQTTPAHQLALSVVYYSPLMVLYWYDKPSDSRDEPELKFFDDVHPVWDDTKVLDGIPGEYATIARRNGEEWFVGLITNNDPRKIACSLNFLDPDKTYTAEIYTDGGKEIPTRTKVKTSTYKVNNKTNLLFELKASGGAAIRIIPEDAVKDKKIKTYKKQQL